MVLRRCLLCLLILVLGSCTLVVHVKQGPSEEIVVDQLEESSFGD